MDSIIIYPKNERQKSLLQSLLEEMKVHFEISRSNEDPLLSKEDFYAKIDKSIKQAESGATAILSKADQKNLLSL